VLSFGRSPLPPSMPGTWKSDTLMTLLILFGATRPPRGVSTFFVLCITTAFAVSDRLWDGRLPLTCSSIVTCGSWVIYWALPRQSSRSSSPPGTGWIYWTAAIYRCPHGPPGPSPIWPGPTRPGPTQARHPSVLGRVGPPGRTASPGPALRASVPFWAGPRHSGPLMG
jgi:hypothetical protein